MSDDRPPLGYVVVGPDGDPWWAYTNMSKLAVIQDFVIHNGKYSSWKSAYNAGFRVRRCALAR